MVEITLLNRDLNPITRTFTGSLKVSGISSASLLELNVEKFGNHLIPFEDSCFANPIQSGNDFYIDVVMPFREFTDDNFNQCIAVIKDYFE